MKRLIEVKSQAIIDIGVKLLTNRNIKKMKKKYKYSISKEYKKSIEGFWAKLNYPMKDHWHTVYSSVNGLQDPRYIPEDLFYCKLEPTLNRRDLIHAYKDKNSYSKMLQGVNEPNILLRNINGTYYNKNYELLTDIEAEQIITSYIGELIVKPSIDSGGGKNVQVLEVREGNIYIEKVKRSFKDTEKEYESDFLIQEMVTQNPVFNRIYPHSLNTIRIITVRWKNEIHSLSTVVRFGNNGSRVDNQAAGGVSCGVENGYLRDYAIDKVGNKYYEHPSTKQKFKGVKIEKYDSILDHVKKLHNQLLYFDIVSWDIATDENCEPVFIELNLSYQEINFHQFNNGPLLGSLTEEICSKVLG